MPFPMIRRGVDDSSSGPLAWMEVVGSDRVRDAGADASQGPIRIAGEADPGIPSRTGSALPIRRGAGSVSHSGRFLATIRGKIPPRRSISSSPDNSSRAKSWIGS